MLLMLFSTIVDFFAGLALGKTAHLKKRKWILFLSISVNVGLLSYFKYFSFLVSQLNAIVNSAGWMLPPFPLAVPEILLPIGISFYTFQSMSYTFDVYRREMQPTTSFIDFAAYIALFPQLVAGPIVRARSVLPYMRDKGITAEKIEIAIHFFTIGLAKKVLIADSLGIACSALHQQETVGVISAWVSIYADVLHWYFDFSGYSDMAIGLGHLFGFSFPQNFNSPLKSASMTELVVKWHMTLITWLRDYVYIPLGGNRRGNLATYRNLFIIMFLSGIWHGAGWTYIVWAFMIAFSLVFERALGIGQTHREKQNWLTASTVVPFRRLRVLIVFTYYALSVSCFTSPTLSHAGAIAKGLLGMSRTPVISEFISPYFLISFVFGIIIVFTCNNTWDTAEKKKPVWFYIVVFLLSIGSILLNKETPFMYYRF